MLAVDWRNPVDALDVDVDGFVAPIDALLIINSLNSGGSRQLPAQRPNDASYLDSDGDQFLAPIDALRVINHLNGDLGSQRLLVESGRLAKEADVMITLGQNAGSRLYRVQLDATFDVGDQQSALEDLLAVYLVAPSVPGQTLIDRGEPGTALFTLSGGRAEFAPGQVRWDGSVLEIDTSSIASRDTGLLRFQLLSSDADSGTRVRVRPLSNQVDPAAPPSSPSAAERRVVGAGQAADLTSLAPADDVALSIENVRFSADTGRYVAELRVENQGAALGSQVAVVFPGLPAGVTMRNPSGIATGGAPYVNVGPAVARGGLGRGARSDAVLLEFDSPASTQFSLRPQILAGANRAPTLAPLPPLVVSPGGVAKYSPAAADADGDALTFSIASSGPLPTGALKADGTLEFRPTPAQIGDYSFELVVSDGTLEARRTATLQVTADPLTTTRVSGRVVQVDGQPLAGMPVEIGAVQGLTGADGRFTLDLGAGPVVSDTLKVRGELFAGALQYPFIAEKLAYMLDHPVYANVDNVIDRSIYLPALDLANGKTINPATDTLVTTAALPDTTVLVKAGTLMNQLGTPFTGVLSITEVPVALTPAALPDNLLPDLVVTIQPGEMVFAAPAPMTFPNRSGWAPGTLMDLWSINPVTGEFDDVGDMRVSDDGARVETISGGVRNSSWHFPAPAPLPPPEPPAEDPFNEDQGCLRVIGSCSATSDVEMHSGSLVETHDLVGYQSQGVARGVTLTYDSQRVNGRPIVGVTYDALPTSTTGDAETLLTASLTVFKGDFQQQAVGSSLPSVPPGMFLWSAPPAEPGQQGVAPSRVAIAADLSAAATGRYRYEISAGVISATGDRTTFAGATQTFAGDLLHVNEIASPFGSGWGVDGLLRLIENPDGSVLLVGGNGAEWLYEPSPTVAGAFDSPAGDFSTLEKLSDGRYRRIETDQTVYQFDLQNRLAHWRDRNQNQTSFAYDAEDRLTSITDPVGMQTVFAYVGGKLASITDPANRVTTFEVDADGDLIRIVDPDGSERRFQYDGAHRMIGEIDQRGSQERVFYDAAGRVERVTRRDGTEVQYRTVQRGAVVQNEPIDDPTKIPVASTDVTTEALMIQPTGDVVRMQLDKAGQIVASRDEVGPLPTVRRNLDNLVSSVVDARGNVTTYAYDERGSLTSQSDAVSGGKSAPWARQLVPFDIGYGLAVGASVDLNRDGRPDLIVADGDGDTLFVRLHQGLDRWGVATYSDAVPYAVASQPRAIVGFDVNGDGAPDVAVLGAADGVVSVLLGDGAGGLGVAASYPVGDDPTEMVAADFNNDGFDDLAVTDYQRYGEPVTNVWVLLADGAGGLAPRIVASPGGQFGAPVAADLNGDGNVDLVGIDQLGIDAYQGTVVILSGAGDGQFAAPRTLAAGGGPVGIDVGDLNGDGVLDIVTGVSNRNSLSLFLGTGGGEFEPRSDLFSGLVGGHNAVRIADFDGDGVADLVVQTGVRDFVVHSGAANWAPGAVQRIGVPGEEFELQDLNADGRLDLTLYDYGQVIQLANDGAGGFASLEIVALATIPFSAYPRRAAVGDLNRDGLTDIVVLISSGNVQTLLGTSTGDFAPLSLASVGLDGQLSVNDLTVADLDGNGTLDLIVTDEAIRWASGLGDGQFAAAQTIGAGREPVFHDLNGDGRLDIVALATDSNQGRLWLRDGGGGVTFTETPLDLGDAPGSLLSTDLNGDGFWDLVVGDAAGLTISVLLGVGDGSFGAAATLAAPVAPAKLIAGDFNADGLIDLAILDDFGSLQGAILPGDGAGGFKAPLPSSYGDVQAFGDAELHVADVDGDGLSDLIVSQPRLAHVLFQNRGAPFTVRTFASGSWAVVADVDDDAAPDLVTNWGVSLGLIRNASGGARGWTYDPLYAQPTNFTDELGRTTQYDVDPATGNTTRVTRIVGLPDSPGGEADDQVTQFAYTAQGLLRSVVDPLGRTSEYAYDAHGRLTTRTDALGTADEAITRFEYDAAGNVTAIVDALGRRTERTYDAMNRLTRLALPDPDLSGPLASPVSTWTLDARGNTIAFTDSLGETTEYAYDPMDRPVEIVDALANATRYGYDAVGNMIRVVDPLGLVTQLRHDARGRVRESIDPDGGRTQFTYDLDDNLTSLVDPTGNETRYVYDARDRVLAEFDPLGEVASFVYDNVNRLVSKTDRLGRVTRRTYDDLDRLASETWLAADGAEVNQIVHAYDALGNLLSIQDEFSQLAATYDARNRPKTVTNAGTPGGAPAVALTYQYDAVGNVLSVADAIGGVAGAVTSQAYDRLDRVVRSTQSGADVSAKRVDFAYDANGRITQLARFADLAGAASVVASAMTYDDLHRLTGLVHRDASNAVVNSFAFQFDAGSRITRITDGDGAHDYAYDARDQLIAATHAAAAIPDETYGFDANGNRTASHLHGSSYQTGPANRLTSDGEFAYAYDDEGNLVRRTVIATNAVREFQYDHRNRLVAVLDKTGAGALVARTDYVYDALDRRIARSTDVAGDANAPRVEHFVYDRDDVILDFVDADGAAGPAAAALQRRYLHGPAVDQVLAQDDGAGGVQWHLTDHLGTVRDLVDNTGDVVKHFVYDSFGAVLVQNATGPESRYLFTGREFDPSVDIYYYRARYYDASVGRFLSEDPLAFAAGDANLYRYVANSPTTSTDPWGLCEKPANFELMPEGQELIEPRRPSSDETELPYIEGVRPMLSRDETPPDYSQADEHHWEFLTDQGVRISIRGRGEVRVIGNGRIVTGEDATAIIRVGDEAIVNLPADTIFVLPQTNVTPGDGMDDSEGRQMVVGTKG